MDKRGYRSLVVWQKAIELAEDVYKLTDRFPSCEQFGLISQLQRSAVSIASNIAEGYSRTHTGDYLKHLSYARGSLAEVETQLVIAVRVGRIDRTTATPVWMLAQEVGRLLSATIQKVQSRNRK